MTDPAAVLGSLGVGLLLLAFVLNGAGRLTPTNRSYLAMNALGAGLACWASVLLGFVPFVVLEATWCAVALAGLIRWPRTAGRRRPA
jgi:hypothetical protein